MTGTDTTTKRWGARSIASLLLFILAVLLTPIALIGHWGHTTVIDSERYLETVGPLAAQPEVQEAVSKAITDAVIAEVDTTAQVEGLLTSLFPDAGFTDQLASPIAAGINSLIGEVVNRFVTSDQFQTAWLELNKAAQKGLVAALEGGQEGPVQVVGDNVVLDISSVLVAIQTRLVENGITAAANVTVPDTDRQIVLMTAPALSQIRLIYSLTSPILQWFPLVIAAMFALSIALARRRPRTVVATGIALFVIGVLLWLGMNTGEAVFVNQLANTAFGSASTAFWATMFAYLMMGIQALLAFGAIVIAAGWFAGRTSSATLLRGHVVRGLGQLHDRLPAGLTGFGDSLRPVASYVRWVIYAVLMLVILLVSTFTVMNVVWVCALGAGLVTVVQLLAGASVPSASISTASEAPITNA